MNIRGWIVQNGTWENKQKLKPEGRNPVEEQSVAQDQVQSLCIMPVKIKGNNKSKNRMTFLKRAY